MKPYDHSKIEKKWQKEWEKNQTYKTLEDSDKPKQFVLDMFPYPSGEGLHVGHPRGYMATDVYSRMKRMQGFNVLHPMGWDAFGLPAENYAIKHKIHPRLAVEENIARFKKQLGLMGVDYDWSREINTTDPAFYKWTQWIFLQMYHKGLAYESWEPINWCPGCQTGLANEDVEGDGTCERCGSKVEKKPMRQWVLRITDYADRMLADLDKLPKWPEGVKEAQRNWIGKSEGAEIDFKVVDSEESIKVFTTRADTLFGVTYVVLAPEHSLIQVLDTKIKNYEEVVNYVSSVKEKTDIDRTNAKKEKTGVLLEGVFAINPANNEQVPVWVADYVLANHGTGAVMAVPAHDERDFAFAKKYDLPIKQVISKYWVLDGDDAERPGLEIVHKKTVDAIIRDHDGNFYIIKEGDHVHMVGGGIDEGEDEVAALKREVTEETGFTDFEVLGRVSPYLAGRGYRHGRNRNMHSIGPAYEIVLNSMDRISSEVEQGEHELLIVKKDQVLHALTWKWHRYLFERYLAGDAAFVDQGVLLNSGEFNDMSSEEARKKITEHVGGEMVSKYKLKDWVFSRQRYWGEPIPIIHCERCGVVPVPEQDLPVALPDVESYAPTGTGESPLANISEWVNVNCPTCGQMAKRETNTMPQWAGSSWYYLRYIDPKNDMALVDAGKEKKWMDVDVYVGGDHATRHLIYARFWHKFLYDLGRVSTEEPFPRLEFLGFILAENGQKMSKSKGNVVSPDDVIAQFGADAFRLYQMFIGPFEQTASWNTNGMVGTLRFVEKFWRYYVEKIVERSVGAFGEQWISNYKNGILAAGYNDKKLEVKIHQTIKKVTEDIENFKFNTAISSLMIILNELLKESKSDRFSESLTTIIPYKDFVSILKLLAPFAPHITEEIWKEALGGEGSIHLAPWPVYDETLIVDDTVTIGIQINGKVRAEITLAVDADEASVRAQVLEIPEITKWTDEKEIKKFIYVPGKIISIVI